MPQLDKKEEEELNSLYEGLLGTTLDFIRATIVNINNRCYSNAQQKAIKNGLEIRKKNKS